MRSTSAQSVKIIRLVAVAALTLWLGGQGCLVGCSSSTAGFAGERDDATLTAVAPQIRAAACASSSSEHDCCRRAQIDKRGVVSRSFIESHRQSPASMRCCSTTGQTLLPAQKTNTETSLAMTAGRIKISPLFITGGLSPNNHARLPDRGGTRLRCCVFLI